MSGDAAETDLTAPEYNHEQTAGTVRSIVVTAPAGYFAGKTMVCRFSRTRAITSDVDSFATVVSGGTSNVCTVTVDTTGLSGRYFWQLQDDTTPDVVWDGVLTVAPLLVHS